MSKINKLGKSTFVIAILSFLLVAVLAFGGTYAYFSNASEKLGGTFTTGTITMSLDEGTSDKFVTDGEYVVPGQPIIESAISVNTATTVNTIMFAVVKATVNAEGTDIAIGTGEAIAFAVESAWNNPVELNDGSIAYVYKSGTNFYFNDNSTDETAKAFTSGPVYLDKSVTNGTDNVNMGVSITLEVTFYTAQYDYLSGTNGVEFAGATAADVYTAVKTHVYTSLEAVKA